MIPPFHYNVEDIPWQYLDGQENQEGDLVRGIKNVGDQTLIYCGCFPPGWRET